MGRVDSLGRHEAGAREEATGGPEHGGQQKIERAYRHKEGEGSGEQEVELRKKTTEFLPSLLGQKSYCLPSLHLQHPTEAPARAEAEGKKKKEIYTKKMDRNRAEEVFGLTRLSHIGPEDREDQLWTKWTRKYERREKREKHVQGWGMYRKKGVC